MKAATHRRSTIFLMELIIAIFIFALAGAVCLNLFVYAHRLSQETEDLDFAIAQTASIAEIVSSASTPADARLLLLSRYPDMTGNTIYYDSDHQMSSQPNAAFSITVSCDLGGLSAWSIQTVDLETGEVIYALFPEVYYGS